MTSEKVETVVLVAPSGSQVRVAAAKAVLLAGMGFKEPKSAEGGVPKGNASREAWAAHAESLGVEFAPEATREEIKAAVEAAQK